MAISAGVLGLVLAVMAADADSASDPISLLLERIVYQTQGWGEMGINTCTHAPQVTPKPLRIGDASFAQGIGTHAPGEIMLDLAGEFLRFEANIGVQRQEHNQGSVVFQVFVDGAKRFDSGVMRESDPARPISIPVEGAYELRLAVTDAGDGIICDCADWADARLVPNPNATPAPIRETADIAPFARVMTWDPNRMEGTKATRIQEFPAEDLFLGRPLVISAQDAYAAPAYGNGLKCIGLEWAERRIVREMGIEFAETAPDSQGARLECWAGESPWQGAWKPLPGEILRDGAFWRAKVRLAGSAGISTGSEKWRWVFPAAMPPAPIRRFTACTGYPWQTAAFRIEMETPAPEQRGEIEMYNGAILPAEGGPAALGYAWPLTEPATLQIQFSRAGACKTNRTVLRFRLPGAAFGVAVDDVLEKGCVYVPCAGLYITQADNPQTLNGYKNEIADRKTILERVRELPDQTFAQAMEKVHNPIQDNGPMMLSLACDNRKFVAYEDGSVLFDLYDGPEMAEIPIPKQYKAVPAFGKANPETFARHLEGGWLPIPVIEGKDAGIIYRQSSMVAPLDDKPIPDSNGWLYDHAVAVAGFTAENTSAAPAGAEVRWTFTGAPVLAAAPVQGGVAFTTPEGRTAALLRLPEESLFAAALEPDAVVLRATIPSGGTAGAALFLPAWKAAPEEWAALQCGKKWEESVREYWQNALAPAADIETPDAFLNNIIRASQVHCLLAARSEERGQRVSAWISSDRYGPLESEAHAVIRGMDLIGQQEYARRALDYFIHRYAPEGFLTTGYTLMGAGWHLWTLAEYCRRSDNRDWLESNAPEITRVCQWIARQCEKTKHEELGRRVPEYGLFPPGVTADWNRFAYRFIQEGHYYAGLHQAAEALAGIGAPEAPQLLAEAAAFRENILRAYAWSQAQSPVQCLADGTWVPAYPSMLGCFGRVEDIIPGEDANRSWAYDVEVGAHHLVMHGVLDPGSPETDWIMNHMEDFWFLHGGMGDYSTERNQADWFNLGGFAKVQPYYARNAEICALRDDIKPFIRSYFNTIPTLLSRENLSFWEHYHNTGGWNKTHETGYFLTQSRTMLLMERGNELWLAPFVTDQWLKDGQRLVIRNAPTAFGPMSYEIDSHLAQGYIAARIVPPVRKPPEAILLRVRAPEGKHPRAAVSTPAADCALVPEKEAVRIVPNGQPVEIRIDY